MIVCPNTNLPEWKELVNKVGEINAYKEYIKNGNNIPTLEQIEALKPEINQVEYNLKAAQILASDKAKEIFYKGKKNSWSLDKILTELQIPKEQKQLILDSGKTSREEILIDLLSNYSYTVEVNTAKDKDLYYVDGHDFVVNNHIYRLDVSEYTDFNGERQETIVYTRDGEPITGTEFELAKENAPLRNSQTYSNLTVPGGTNYTENEISAPAIIPSIKGHAQFATDNGIGWFRSDDKLDNSKESLTGYYNEDTETFTPKYEGDQTKTRRILEVQSDLFQKGRDNDVLSTDYGKYISKEHASKFRDESTFEKGLKNNKFLQLLNKDNNWVTFFIKSIIQSTAKQTITEVQQEDVEAKVRELEKSGLLKIKCD